MAKRLYPAPSATGPGSSIGSRRIVIVVSGPVCLTNGEDMYSESHNDMTPSRDRLAVELQKFANSLWDSDTQTHGSGPGTGNPTITQGLTEDGGDLRA